MKIKIATVVIMSLVSMAYADKWHIVTTNSQGIVTGVSTEENCLPPHTLGPNEYPADYAFPTNAMENWKKNDNNDWVEMTPEDIQARYDAMQAAKPMELKTLENMYVTFLTNEWTTALRTAGIIAPDKTITVTNTDTTANMSYLIYLRQIDTQPNKPTYSYYKGEFATFRATFERMSGSNAMQNVRWHPEIVASEKTFKTPVSNKRIKQ